MAKTVIEKPAIPSRQRLTWIDTFRGFAVLAVVLHHAELQITDSMDIDIGFITIIDDSIGPFRMPLLMLLSGFLLPTSLAKPASVYISGKLKKIAWPYLVWSALFLGLLVAAAPIRGEAVPFEEFLKIFYAPPTYHWYLAYLVLYYLLALPLSQRPWLRTSTIPLALFAATFTDGDIQKLLFMWACFMTGDALSVHWGTLQSVLEHPATIIIATGFAIPVIAVSIMGSIVRFEPLWFLGIIAPFFALRPLAEKVSPTIIGSGLSAMGRQSLIYYVSHYMIITVLFHILLRLGVSSPSLLFLLVSVLSLATGYTLVLLSRFQIVAWLFEWNPKSRPRPMA